jgi:hypothetical protein
MASPLESFTVNLTSAGSAQQISTTSIRAKSYIFRPRAGNVGLLYIGNSSVDNTVAPVAQGDAINWKGNQGEVVDLEEFYFDGGTTNDDLDVWYEPA